MEFLVNILPYIQLGLSILLVVGILMQQSDASLGAAFGGGNDAGGIQRTRRGAERMLFNATIILAILFVLSMVIELFI